MLTHIDNSLRNAFNYYGVEHDLVNTGGGCMVLQIPLSNLDQFAWLTRDGEDWVLGLHDFGPCFDVEDDGFWVIPVIADKENPFSVALVVRGILLRCGAIQQHLYPIDVRFPL